MKLFIYTLATLIVLMNKSFAQPKIVGEVQDETFFITANRDSLIEVANKILETQNTDATLTNVNIKRDAVNERDEIYYYLLFSNRNETIKLAQILKEEDGKLLTLKSSLAEEMSTTCSGCKTGCDPKLYVDKDKTTRMYCSDCKSGKKDCTKTVSISPVD